jgi:hypothetical protein
MHFGATTTHGHRSSAVDDADASLAATPGSLVREVLAPVAIVFVGGLALVPAGRPLAWLGLLAVVAVLGRVAGRTAGLTAAGSAVIVYMWAHGAPRFAGRVTDPSTIRLAFVLGVLGSVAALLADRHPRPSAHR